MLTLSEFITANTQIATGLRDSDAADSEWPVWDLVFEHIACDPDCNKAQFEQLLRAQRPMFQTVIDPLDGQFYSYITLGLWLGDQPTALRLLALGAQLETWTLITPYDVKDDMNRPLARALATLGLLGEVVECR